LRLTGKVALVTGGARGIGRAIVEKLMDNGCGVVIADVLDDAGNQTVAELSNRGEVTFVHCDVTCAEDAQKAVDHAVAKFGTLDILVNNAGITKDTLLIRMTESDWDRVLTINLKGAFLVTQAASRVMMKARSGRIINISSVVGLMGNAGQGNYAASKAGLIGFTKSIAKELAGRGVTVNAVAPGYIQTEMTESLPETAKQAFLTNIPLKRAGVPEDVANAVLFFAADESTYITGQVLPVCGGLLM
jgi:3-oxoacyl-[acyl-carrier protein] reductase